VNQAAAYRENKESEGPENNENDRDCEKHENS
jgi:hypothetical protein